METLSSLRNPRVMMWKSLKDRKGRLEHQAFLVEGEKMVREAVASSFPVESILLREDVSPSFDLPPETECFMLPVHVFDAVCESKTPQGIAAVLRPRPLPAEGSWLIALDQVQDPGNVGTILRTADAAGFQGALLGPGCADAFSPRALRGSMGSIFHIGISFPESLAETLRQKKEEGYAILSSQLDGEPFFQRAPVSPPLILVVGNEGNGISPQIRALATHRFLLPMRGEAESLNVAIAAGIMMYDLIR